MLDAMPRAPRCPAVLAGTVFLGRDAVTEGLFTTADLVATAA
jgi:hypothetical protein